MSDCCPSSRKPEQSSSKHICPINGMEYKQVPFRTVIHHLRKPWQWKSATKNYYFCDDPDCEVVYFGEDNTTIDEGSLRHVVGIKDRSDDAIICYCFGVSRADAVQDTNIIE